MAVTTRLSGYTVAPCRNSAVSVNGASCIVDCIRCIPPGPTGPGAVTTILTPTCLVRYRFVAHRYPGSTRGSHSGSDSGSSEVNVSRPVWSPWPAGWVARRDAPAAVGQRLCPRPGAARV